MGAILRGINKHVNAREDFRHLKVIWCLTKQYVNGDWINDVPKEIICCIVAVLFVYLMLVEAGRTGILSKRRKHVWTNDLDFTPFTTFCKIVTVLILHRITRERPKFVNWVDEVLQSHQDLVFDKFIIYCDLNYSFQKNLNRRLQYALNRRLQKLEVNRLYRGLGYFPRTQNYVRRSPFFTQRGWISFEELNFMRNLVHHFYDHETADVHCSEDLTTFEVHGPSLALQHLIMSIVFLLSLKIGISRALMFKNIPQLGVLSNGYPYPIEDDVWRLSCCFSKPGILPLCLNFKQTREVTHFKSCTSKTKAHVHGDRISQLPNDIICCILSFLTLKEAGRTSILSKRWKHVWAYVHDLDFNAFTTFCETVTGEGYLERITRERPKFVDWVNMVLQSHQCLVLNKFRIYCDLNNSFQKELNKWLQYAFDRRVQRLEVNLSHHGPGYFPSTENYVFCSEFFGPRSLTSLKELILKRVSISGGTLQLLLRGCKFLESLVVHCSNDLETLMVSGPNLALKHLEINFCPLKILIINNVDLISLKIGVPEALVLQNVPQLIHIGILSNGYCIEDVICRLSCCFSKLVVLSLCLDSEQIREYDRKLPQLPALKLLSLHLCLVVEESMFGLTSFFRASPNLEKFLIKTLYPFRIKTSRKSENLVNYSVQHLRVVEISEYRGRSIELELVKYFLENAISLEKIIVDPRYTMVGSCGEEWFCDLETRRIEAEITNEARRCAKEQLLGLVPSHVTLMIL